MRRTTITTFIICLMFTTLMANGQPPKPFHPEKLNDDEIICMQIRDIVSWLDLDEQKREIFTKEYTAFRKEIDAVAKNALPPRGTESEEEIDKALQKSFEVSEQILKIRKKYYQRFREFLKPSQIKLMYRIEKEAGRRMHEGPLGPDGPKPHGEFPPAPDAR